MSDACFTVASAPPLDEHCPPPDPEPVAVVQPLSEKQLLGLLRDQEQLTPDADGPDDPDTFHRLLQDYLSCRRGLVQAADGVAAKQDQAEALESDLWTFLEQKSILKAKCHDGKEVESIHHYKRAEFNASAAAGLRGAFKEIKTLLADHQSVHAFHASSVKLNLEQRLVPLLKPEVEAKQGLKMAIGTLFSFQRKRWQDQVFVSDTRHWLEQSVVTLFRKPDSDFQDLLFVLQHVLRCAPGFGRWASGLIQPNVPVLGFNDTPDYDHPALNQVLAVLSVITSPPAVLPPSEDREWVLVDSDGEDDPESFKESDLVALINQVPLGGTFRYLLKVQGVDGQDRYLPEVFSEMSFLKLLAYSSKLIAVLRRGLESFCGPSYRQFSKRVGNMACQVVQYVTDHWDAYKGLVTASGGLFQRMQVEYDEFHLRAVMCLFSSQNSGVWQYLVRIPYNSISSDMLWKILYVLCFNPAFRDCDKRGKPCKWTTKSRLLTIFFSRYQGLETVAPKRRDKGPLERVHDGSARHGQTLSIVCHRQHGHFQDHGRLGVHLPCYQGADGDRVPG